MQWDRKHRKTQLKRVCSHGTAVSIMFLIPDEYFVIFPDLAGGNDDSLS